MNKIEQLYLEVIDKELNNTGVTHYQTIKNTATELAKITKQIAIEFAEFTVIQCRVFPDGWHYKGDGYSTQDLFEEFLKTK